jgi:uncharacterized protein
MRGIDLREVPMPDTHEGNLAKPDRKLGDEWTDWKGDTGSVELEANERSSTFLILAGVIFLFFIALLNAGWYLIKPRVEQFSPVISLPLELCVEIFSILLLMIVAVETIAVVKFGKSLLPYVWTERVLLSLLPKSVWLGKKFGISRDRISNSFIKVHNIVLKASPNHLCAERLLVLLPRCLERATRSQVLNRLEVIGAKTVTASGGEEARKAIQEHRPSVILAIACERDLISGLKDVANRIPVLAIPNRRPQGPCKNTQLPIEELDAALRFLAERKEAREMIDQAT